MFWIYYFDLSIWHITAAILSSLSAATFDILNDDGFYFKILH